MTDPLARLLIVDDDAKNVRVLCENLRRRGYDAEGFATGAEALDALGERSFDILLTDLMMPEMDGVAVIAAAAAIDPHMVAVLMTGDGTIETAVQAMQAGALDYVLKPLRIDTLLPVLVRAAAVRRLRLENLELRNTVAIQELNQAIAQAIDATVLLDKVGEAALSQFDADEASVMLVSEDGASLHVSAARGEHREMRLGARVALGENIAGHVAARREPLVAQGDVRASGLIPLYHHPEILTALCMPMMTRGKLVGVLNLNYTRKARRIPPGQVEVFRLFANAAAAGVEAARLHEGERRTQARYSEVLSVAADGIVSIDHDHRVVLFNRAAERIFGYTPEEALGLPIATLLPTENGEAAPSRMDPFGGAAGPQDPGTEADRVAGRRKDGTPFYAEVSVSDHSGDSELSRTVIVRDVTERVALEDQLRQAQKMEAVGQLTGGIAHDFNNILTVIVANAEILAAGFPADSEPQESLQELLIAARRGATMVGRLLQFSRRGILSMRAVRPGAVVADLHPMLRRLLPVSIELTLHDGTDPTDAVMADTGAIEQALVNLCTNARDAMPDGGRLRIECERTWLDEGYHATHPWVRPGAYVAVSVSDSGTGMDENTRRRLFEPFFTTKPAGKGTGLGMAMVYGLMKQHSGMTHVYSEVGRGTTVRLYFPTTTDAETQVPQPRAAGVPRAMHGTETILLAEDEPAIRRATRRALEGKGYRVLVAEDGEEALEICARHRDEIALVISDLVMPKLGGRQLAEALRQMGSNVPILFTSGYSPESASGTAGLMSGVGFLQKPWVLTDLFSKVRGLLEAEGS